MCIFVEYVKVKCFVLFLKEHVKFVEAVFFFKNVHHQGSSILNLCLWLTISDDKNRNSLDSKRLEQNKVT